MRSLGSLESGHPSTKRNSTELKPQRRANRLEESHAFHLVGMGCDGVLKDTKVGTSLER